MGLSTLVASAADLLSRVAHHSQPAADILSGSVPGANKPQPACVEPYCGGYSWAATPLESRRPLRPPAPPLAPPTRPTPPAKPAVAEFEAKVGGDAAEEPDPDNAPPPGGVDGAPKEPARVDLPNARFFPPLNPPLTRVKLQAADRNRYDWWDSPNIARVTVKSRSERRILVNKALNDFLDVSQDMVIGGKRIRRGLELLTIHPKGGKLRTRPWLRGKRVLEKDKLPIELTFGGVPSTHKRNPWDTPVVERKPDLHPPVLQVKRLDIVLQRPPEEASGHESLPPGAWAPEQGAGPASFLSVPHAAGLTRRESLTHMVGQTFL